MDKSEIRAILNETLRPMRAALSLNDWYVDFKLESMDGSYVAECVADPNYTRARLTFDHDAYKNEADLLESLLHEYLHVMLARFELYRKAVRPLIEDENVWASLEEVFVNASEESVRRIEDLLRHGLHITPRRLITRGRKLLDLDD